MNLIIATIVFGFKVLALILVLGLVALALLAVVLVIVLSLRRKTPAPSVAGPTEVVGPRKCPQCGAGLNPDAPEGLCPACLLQRGIATDAAPPGQPPFTPPPFGELARLFPQLEILELIGQGGMGAVYKARQAGLDRFVALKILAPRSGNDVDFASRFTREARALAKLSHPNIVGVYDFGQAEGLNYFIMEYVDGPNLRQVQQAGRLAPREALSIIPQICAALQFAHDEGVVHRDIKPENVLLDKKGRVRIADFGLAKILGQEPPDFRLTGAKDVMGTPHYMAPEQVERPREVDHRADIYSLGVVFYEMLTGELPLGKFQPPSSKVQVDVRLDEVVLRTLAKEPERRYQQASHLKTDVETIATTQSAATATPSAVRKINWIPALVFYGLADAVWFIWSVAVLFGHRSAASAFALALIPCWMASSAAWAILHYSCWKALPQKFRATTPAQALGFMFIPLFNFYWAFISFPKLAEGFNAAQRERPELELRNLKPLGIAFAVLFVGCWLLGWIPLCAVFLAVADLLLFVFFYGGIVSNANRLMQPAGPAKRVPAIASQAALAVAIAVICVGAVAVFVRLKPGGSPPQVMRLPQPVSGESLSQDGWQLWQAQRPAEAIPKFRQAVELSPSNANAWNGLGWALFNSGSGDEATNAFQKVLALQPEHPAALNGLGQIYLAERKYDEAEHYLLKAAPQAQAAWYGLARLYLLEGKFEQAERWAQNVVDSGQGDEIARLMLRAAQTKRLSEGLRLTIEPPLPPAAAQVSAAVGTTNAAFPAR